MPIIEDDAIIKDVEFVLREGSLVHNLAYRSSIIGQIINLSKECRRIERNDLSEKLEKAYGLNMNKFIKKRSKNGTVLSSNKLD